MRQALLVDVAPTGGKSNEVDWVTMVANIYWLPNAWPGRLAIAPRPRGGDWLEDEMSSWKRAGANIVVSLLTRDEVEHLELQGEEAASRANGMEFVSYPIVDRGVPDSTEETTKLAAKIAGDLQSGRNIIIHCRQGIGRSALLAAAVLTIIGLGVETALGQISEARSVPVPETTEQKRWIINFAESQAAVTTN